MIIFKQAFPIIFRAKGFNDGEVGLAFLGMGLGIVFATVLNATYYTASYARTAKKLGHKPPPEEHLKKGMLAAVIGPISLFAFAWTSQPSVHWIAPILLSMPFGMAFTLAVTCSFTYKVGELRIRSLSIYLSMYLSKSLRLMHGFPVPWRADAYRPYAASAMGANSFLRSSFAAGYPL
jgi:hypothetical protein